jgi:hypothetical protein
MDILKYISSLYAPRTLALLLRAAVFFTNPLFFFLMYKHSRAQDALYHGIHMNSCASSSYLRLEDSARIFPHSYCTQYVTAIVANVILVYMLYIWWASVRVAA